MLVAAAGQPAFAAREISLLDLIELDMGYTTISDQYYRNVAPQVLLDGARTGLAAELRLRGIADPAIPLLHARSDGRGVVPVIEQQVGKILVHYGSRVDAGELVYAAIRGELAALHDPYSIFLSKRELAGFTTALDGRSFGGIGVVLAVDAAGFHADQVFDGGPAARAGLQPGDHIVVIDRAPAAGFSATALGQRLRGAIGTIVRLTVRRDGVDGELPLTITRAAVTPPDVTARLLTEGVGYLALRGFGPAAGEQVHAALGKLRRQGARSTIFDLRGNGGGYESSAVRVASALIPNGPIVATQTNRGRRRMTLADGSALAVLPLAVLVDRDSASGSELVTGAIQDRRLGKVVGTRTFGKGLVQTMFPLPDGSAMKVTTARYFTPNGRDIDRIGITPDIVVDEPAEAVHGEPGHDPQLDAAIALLAP